MISPRRLIVLDVRHSGGLPSADLMNDESEPTPVTPPNPPPATAPRGRRISSNRPQKPGKGAATPAAELPQPPVAEPDVPTNPPSPNDWPEPEPASAGSSGHQENPKRKRRRKKGKGNAPHNPFPPAAGEEPAPPLPDDASALPPPTEPPKASPTKPERPPRPKIDPDLIAERAWKIYLAEISEEGVALVGEGEARDLSRRCFRLAEIFLEEQSRRR